MIFMWDWSDETTKCDLKLNNWISFVYFLVVTIITSTLAQSNQSLVYMIAETSAFKITA